MTACINLVGNDLSLYPDQPQVATETTDGVGDLMTDMHMVALGESPQIKRHGKSPISQSCILQIV